MVSYTLISSNSPYFLCPYRYITMTKEVTVLPLIPNVVKLDTTKFKELYEVFGYQLQNFMRVFYGNEDTNELVIRDFVVIEFSNDDSEELHKVFFDLVKATKEEYETSTYSDDIMFVKTDVDDYYKLQIVTEDIPSQAIIISLQQNTTTEPVSWTLTFMDIYTLEQIKVDGTLDELLPTIAEYNSDADERVMLDHLAYLYGYNLEDDRVYVPIINMPSANPFSANTGNDDSFKWVRMGDVMFPSDSKGLDEHHLQFNEFGDKSLGYFNWDDKITITGITRCNQEVLPLIEKILVINRKHITTTIEDLSLFNKMFDEMQTMLEARSLDLNKPAAIAVDIYFEQHDRSSLQLCVKGYFLEVPPHGKFNNHKTLLMQDDIVYPANHVHVDYDNMVSQKRYVDNVTYKLFPNEALVIEVETACGLKTMVNGVLYK